MLLPIIILLIPRSVFPVEGLTIAEHRVIALFVFAMCFWVLEPIPIFAVSCTIASYDLTAQGA